MLCVSHVEQSVCVLKVLWPMLLCYLTPSPYFNATTPLCKSLILLANKKRSAQEPNFIINFNAPGEYHISNTIFHTQS